MPGRRHNAKGDEFSFDDSKYTDDTAVLFDSRESVATFCLLLIKHFNIYGIEVHDDIRIPNKLSKTEVLFVVAPNSLYAIPSTFDSKNLDSIDLDENRFISVVDRFCYLGIFYPVTVKTTL